MQTIDMGNRQLNSNKIQQRDGLSIVITSIFIPSSREDGSSAYPARVLH
jgi:hypothetical protein